MPKATLEQWRMFKAVVDHGGFNQAASAVYKSQSTVHHAVQKLEQTLGVALLRVEGRKALLTAAGELMYRRANYLLDEAKKLESLATALGDGVEAKLTIAVDEAFNLHTVLQAIDQVASEYPSVSINLVETILAGATEAVEAGTADLAISPITSPGSFSEELCSLTFVGVMAAHHPLAQHSAPITIETLKSHRQIVVRDSAQSRDTDSGWLGADHRFTVGHMASSVAMVRQGLGFAWLPRDIVAPYIKSGELVTIDLAEGATRTSRVYLHFIDGDKLGPAARTFIGALRSLTG